MYSGYIYVYNLHVYLICLVEGFIHKYLFLLLFIAYVCVHVYLYRVRRLKKEKELQRRRNDAAVVIQRALALKYKRLRINLVNNRIVSPPNAKQSTTAGKNAETTRHGSRSPSRANRAKK